MIIPKTLLTNQYWIIKVFLLIFKEIKIYPFFLMTFILSSMCCLKVLTLHTSFFDLGVFDWNIWAISTLSQWQRAFWGHVQPIMLIAGMGYWLCSCSYLLVFFQALFLSAPLLLIPKIYQLNSGEEEKFAKNLNVNPFLPVLAYILFFPVWFNALFDFHMDHIVVLQLFCFYLLCFKRRWGWAAITGMSLALVKEVFSLTTIGCGLYIICKELSGFQRKGLRIDKFPYLTGSIMIVFGAAYFYFAVYIISPHFNQGERTILEGSAFSWMGTDFREMVMYLASHPFEVAKEIILTPKKIIYVTALFTALAFVPILSPIELIPAIPILAISLLSSFENYFGLGNHYTAGLITPLIIAFITGIPRAKNITEKFGLSTMAFSTAMIVIMLSCHILISPSPISRLFWTDKIWDYGISAYINTSRNREITKAVIQYVPADPNVAVATQNTFNLSFLAKRDVYLPFPESVLEPHTLPNWDNPGEIRQVVAQYVVIDLKRPFFIADKGCEWQYGECRDDVMADTFMKTVAETKKLFTPVYEHDGFMVLKRKR